jgi:hypothetical protein
LCVELLNKFICLRDRLNKAVSEPEKKAEQPSNISITII